MTPRIRKDGHLRKDDKNAIVFGTDGVLDGYFDVVQGDVGGAC